jgi:murein DD-endopeptidase MepM/ murein hydrolase activator NlpD
LSLKKITIVYLPDGIKAVRQFRAPKILVSLTAIFVLLASAFLVWATSDYLDLKKNIPDNLSLMQENAQYKNQLTTLAGKIDQLNKKMAELKGFENKLKSMVNLDAAEGKAQFLGKGGSSDASLLDTSGADKHSPQKLVSLMHQSLDNLNTEIAVQTRQKTQLLDFLENQKSIFSRTPSVAPTVGWVSSGFGYRISPFTNKREFHSGLDISSRIGTEILATADGVVSSIEKTDGLGNNLTITHGYGYQTLYGHLSKVLVTKGQAVKRGDNIALMGNTGRSTGSHLHYEVHLNGVTANPERYILN